MTPFWRRPETIAQSKFGPFESSPTNGPLPPRLQRFVDATERFAPPKTAVGRKRTGVWGGNQCVDRPGLPMFFEQCCVKGLGGSPPQNPNQRLLRLHQVQQRRLDQQFPPQILMRACLSQLGGECRVEHQDALLGPVGQIGRTGLIQLQIAGALLEHVSQGRWHRQGRVGHAECQTMSLSRSVIRILPQKHDPHFRRCSQLKSPPYGGQRWTKDVGAFCPHDFVFKFTGRGFSPIEARPRGKPSAPCVRGLRPRRVGCHGGFA